VLVVLVLVLVLVVVAGAGAGTVLLHCRQESSRQSSSPLAEVIPLCVLFYIVSECVSRSV
jgi:flagellar basal body-associated protein FliL